LQSYFKKIISTKESWSDDHRYPGIPNFEWGNERNETCCDLSYNLKLKVTLNNIPLTHIC
jgi:hypothetical protein